MENKSIKKEWLADNDKLKFNFQINYTDDSLFNEVLLQVSLEEKQSIQYKLTKTKQIEINHEFSDESKIQGFLKIIHLQSTQQLGIYADYVFTQVDDFHFTGVMVVFDNSI